MLSSMSGVSERCDFFATSAPGIEPILQAEAKALKLPRVERQVGGIAFVGTIEDAWRANLWLRTSIRVLRRVARFHARTADQLYDDARDVEWERFLRPDGTLLVDARTRASNLDHSQFIEQVVKDAVVDRFRDATGERPSVDKDDPDLRINTHLYEDRVTLSVDTSGHSLHRRGWRRHQGRAPLAETTAAALVLASGWNRRAPLVDPFCGTGTILIEGGWIAGNVAPGLMRRFAFERWLDHRPEAYAAVQAAACAAARPTGKLRLIGSDRSPERIEEARENALAAGLEDRIELTVQDALDFEPRPGWNATLVTNPPYGQRVGEDEDLVALYRAFGQRLRDHWQGSSLTLLTGDPQLRKALGLRRPELSPLTNGGLECELVRMSRIDG